MKYKSELLRDGEVKKSAYFDKATHPNQCLARFISICPDDINVIAIMNEKGDRWLYTVRKNSNIHEPILRKQDHSHFNSYDVEMIMSGNKQIYEVKEL